MPAPLCVADPWQRVDANPLERFRNFWSLVKGWTPSVPPHDNVSRSHAELERGWRTGHMNMGTNQVVLHLMELVLAGFGRRRPNRYQW